jgi:hypothetical protein
VALDVRWEPVVTPGGTLTALHGFRGRKPQLLLDGRKFTSRCSALYDGLAWYASLLSIVYSVTAVFTSVNIPGWYIPELPVRVRIRVYEEVVQK